MHRLSLVFTALIAALLLAAPTQNANANIWLDETFENDPPLQQSDGAGDPVEGWDTYSANALGSTVTATTGYTASGTRVTSKSYVGSASYQLNVGQSLAVGPEYQDAQNGNFQLFQFAINIDPIPAAGDVAEFRWNLDMDNTDPAADNSFYVKFVSDGTSVDIIAGEDLANVTPDEASIGTLSGTTEWANLTVLVQKDSAATTDSRFPDLGAVDQGVYFFNNSWTAAHSVDLTGGDATTFSGRDWSFTVQSGTIYLDDMYWDGGLDDDPVTSNFRPFGPSSVNDWHLIQ